MPNNTTAAQDKIIAQVDNFFGIEDKLTELREIIEDLDNKLEKANRRIEELESLE